MKDASDVITILDADGIVTYASPAMQRVLGMDPTEVVGARGIDLIHPDDLVRVGAAVTAASGVPEGRQRVQARVARADGSYCPCEIVISDRHADPSVRGTVVSIRDIAELVALHDKLSHQALHDPLTELPNRTNLERRLNEALAACDDDRRVAALFVDLDGFKAIND
ncbi:MAG: PAS domain S-box protein, partial [Actinobacteria bacterium]|nr:PAS domain S-box protein [Actinomycetota bacterium]